MDDYISKLKDDLAKYEAKSGLSDSVSVLELLWQVYLETNPVDDGRIQKFETALKPVFRELSVPASDALTDLIADLCAAYQRAALLEGIHIGMQLADRFKEPFPSSTPS